MTSESYQERVFYVRVIHATISHCNHLHYFSDDIIRRRLLIEGDGGNDDRKISTLLKTFIKWCNSKESQEER